MPIHQVGLQGPVVQHDCGALLEDFYSCANTEEDVSNIEHSIIYIRTSWCPDPDKVPRLRSGDQSEQTELQPAHGRVHE